MSVWVYEVVWSHTTSINTLFFYFHFFDVAGDRPELLAQARPAVSHRSKPPASSNSSEKVKTGQQLQVITRPTALLWKCFLVPSTPLATVLHARTQKHAVGEAPLSMSFMGTRGKAPHTCFRGLWLILCHHSGSVSAGGIQELLSADFPVFFFFKLVAVW